MIAPNGLRVSLAAYRRLLRVYPRIFHDEFGEQMVQAFGDLARRALSGHGLVGLAVLWVRVLPDIARSAAREYLYAATRLGPSDPRGRWILACTFGSGLGVLAGAQVAGLLAAVGLATNLAGSIGLTLGLGLFQSVWALRRTGSELVRWLAATLAGVFALAVPFRVAIVGGGGLQLVRLPVQGEIAALVLAGAGIGLLQYLASRGTGARAWRWVAVNAIGFLSARFVAIAVVQTAGTSAVVLLVAPFVGGLVFGCLTVIALDSVRVGQEGDAIDVRTGAS